MIDEIIRTSGVSALYGVANVVISLRRLAGFGLASAEVPWRGRPMAASGWPGGPGFLLSRTGIPARHSLVPARRQQGAHRHPDMTGPEAGIEEATLALRGRRAHPAPRAARGHPGM